MTKILYIKQKVSIESLEDHKNLPDKIMLTPLQEFLIKENREQIIKKLTRMQFVLFILKEYGFNNAEITKILGWDMNKIYKLNYKIKLIRAEIAKK